MRAAHEASGADMVTVVCGAWTSLERARAMKLASSPLEGVVGR
jgi:hypothetical protein